MDNHKFALKTLCRVCGIRCIKQPMAKYEHGELKCTHRDKLKTKYKVNIDDDDSQVHPEFVCLCCIADCNISRESARPLVQWNKHGPDCVACEIIRKSRKGGRRPKPAKVGAKRRHEREDREERTKKQVEEVKAACQIIISNTASTSTSNTECQRMLQMTATTIVKNMLETTDDGIVELPTGGPKLVLQKVIKPKVPSNTASKSTVRSRTNFLQKMITQLSSPEETEEAAKSQMTALFKGKSRSQLSQMVEAAGLLKIKIPAGHELAMKAKYGWTWEFMRSLKRWFQAYKISFVCESNTRQAKAEILKASNISKEMLPFLHKQDKETITKLTPMVSIPDVHSHILGTLDKLNEKHLLTWKDMPEDEIWVKIGGDAGGGSTKFYYQIVNVEKPNSRTNTTCFVAYTADESLPNLHIALDRFRDQINALESTEWRGKKIVTWLCADILLVCKLLGLQGSSATHPCMCCHAKKDELLCESQHVEPRSIKSIIDDYAQVEAKGFTPDAKRAHHSVSHQPFFNIPLERVCIPSLHISLGLWNKFYKLLEEDVANLGNVIAQLLSEESQSQDSQEESNKFKQHIKELRLIGKDIRQKRADAEALRDQMSTLEYSCIFQALSSPSTPSTEQLEEMKTLHDKAQELEADANELERLHKIEDSENPLLIGLDETLKTFKVKRQAWHGKTFNGNHVHKCLKEKNYTVLLNDVVKTATQLCSSDTIVDMVERVRVKYLLLFQKFAGCYTLYNQSGPMTSADIDNLEENINDLVNYYKNQFPGKTFTPKFHLLLCHLIDFIKKTHLGLGKLSEQGGEQLHHEFNEIGRKMEGVRNVNISTCDPDLQHLANTMEEHLVRVNPGLREVIEMLEE